MIYGEKPLLPLRDGYAPDIPNGTTTLVLPGGASELRRRQVTPITTVRARYLLTSCEMIQWYKAWYRSATLEGGDTFTARLAIDNATFADYTVQFVSPPTIRQDGYRGLVTCEYEVLSRNTTVDNCPYIVIYDEYGNCSKCVVEDVRNAVQW